MGKDLPSSFGLVGVIFLLRIKELDNQCLFGME
jgi:hypothetical protein